MALLTLLGILLVVAGIFVAVTRSLTLGLVLLVLGLVLAVSTGGGLVHVSQ